MSTTNMQRPVFFEPDRMCVEPGSVTNETRVKGLVGSTIVFFIIFFMSWPLLMRYWPRFRTYTDAVKADNCSRVCSTFHAAVVCPMILYGILTTQWGKNLEVINNASHVQIPIAFSMGYFISDFYVLLRFRPRRWPIFIIHHLFAVIPYVVYLLTPCNYGVFILTSYLLVETCNTIYNVKQWMEDCNIRHGAFYWFLTYVNLAAWFLFRCVLPAWLVYLSDNIVIRPYQHPLKGVCLNPGYFCGILVNLFCEIAFWTILVPEVYHHWFPKNKASKSSRKK